MDIVSLTRYFGALLLTLALIGALVIVVRRFAPHLMNGGAPLARGGPGKQRRLRITETLALDPRRRAVLVRWDDVESLIILGTQTETLIASAPVAPDEDTPAPAQDGRAP